MTESKETGETELTRNWKDRDCKSLEKNRGHEGLEEAKNLAFT